MNELVTYLASYAAYHRDKRNIATHFLGIPIIVLSILCLGFRPSFLIEVGEGMTIILNVSLGLYIISSVFYLRLDLRLGLLMVLFHGVLFYLASLTHALTTASWLVLSIGLFVLGWVVQFIGHYFEGKKPAFVDDVMGLVIGPLFVVAEACFLCRSRVELQQQIERIAGPVK